ncbi:MAG: hypothetical protein IH897_11120, partial [Planctomycetes bacterium]|nr:hypothetical protein [Planctomycetota bacterium]
KTIKWETKGLFILAATLMGGLPVLAGETESQTRILLTVDRAILPAGDRIAIDVLVADVEDLQTFQVTLEVEGGKQGSLELEQIVIDENRRDYVFGRGNALDVTNVKTREAGAVQLTNSVDAAEPALLATFLFRASRDAAGTFTVSLAGSEHTFLRDADALAIECRTDSTLNVTIVDRVKARRADRQ